MDSVNPESPTLIRLPVHFLKTVHVSASGKGSMCTMSHLQLTHTNLAGLPLVQVLMRSLKCDQKGTGDNEAGTACHTQSKAV